MAAIGGGKGLLPGYEWKEDVEGEISGSVEGPVKVSVSQSHLQNEQEIDEGDCRSKRDALPVPLQESHFSLLESRSFISRAL
jgi:hypothetical protein